MQERREPAKTPLNGSPGSPRRELQAYHLDTSHPLVGTIIYERYSILGRLGEGGMGEVLLAYDKDTESQVAVKLMSEKFSKVPDMRKRFFVEVEASIKIDHPNVIKMMKFGLFRNRLFCVMEKLDGTDLDKIKKTEERMSWERLKPIMEGVCNGVQAAHDLGILHRDLKPSNIFITRTDGKEFAKVLDFGLAKLQNSNDGEQLTAAGLILGTLSYMAPEQASGKKDLDSRIDVYAAGIMMYELLTGVVPFKSDDILQVINMHKETPPRPPMEIQPDIPEAVQKVILRCLEKDRERRYASMNELYAAIAACDGKSNSGDLVLQDTMQESQVRRVPPETAKAAVYREPARQPPPMMEEEKKPSRTFGRVMKALTAAAVVAGAIIGYQNCNVIKGWYRDFDKYYKEATAPAPPSSSILPVSPSVAVKPVVSAPPQVTGYIVSVKVKNVDAASVWEITTGNKKSWISSTPVSGTPMNIRLDPGVHRLSIEKKGYNSVTVDVSESKSEVNVNMTRVFYRPVVPTATEPVENPKQEDKPPPPDDGQ